MRRSTMYMNVLGLLNDGVINLEDLHEFSDDLKEYASFCYKRK